MAISNSNLADADLFDDLKQEGKRQMESSVVGKRSDGIFNPAEFGSQLIP